ncbi:PREDICTED: inner nuclear membrane protein Man1-like [Rhagoletis zephyria]|uniref:inner nuclear membrane protein Man1-like n=1 Tax=Rhagoletis zephyria TaxID=28612 RepID=UPI000811912E|nr:PREDICTED: inner nuclear membrane protein Man1-like [Rhagoletis zephyria]
MSLKNLEELTDVELHRKLLEYDFPNVPITETSRGFLVKKLQNHLKNLKSRKLLTNNCVTLRARQELENFVAQANDWSRHSIGAESRIRDATTFAASEQSVSDGDDIRREDQLHQTISNSLHSQNRRIRAMSSNEPVSTSSTDSPSDYFSMIWRVLGLQENYTNCVWWGFTIFFIYIAFIYMTKTTDMAKYINEGNTHYVTCDTKDPAGPLLRPPFVCIEKERLEPALAIVRNLIKQLRSRTERHYCYDQTQPEAMTVTEFVRSMLEEGHTVDVRNIKDAQYLITCNPQWKLDMVDHRGTPTIFNGVDKILSDENTFFILKQLHLPIKCLVLLKAHRLLSFVGNVTLLMCVVLMLYLLYRYMRGIQEQHRRDVQNLIQSIVEELQQRASDSDSVSEHEVIVNHLRDELIPVSTRKCKLKLWNEALRDLEENYSQIRFDVTVRCGEEFRTMRWMDNTTQSTNGRIGEDGESSTEVETSC